MQSYLFFPTIGYLCIIKNKDMKNILLLMASAILLSSCHESLEKRAQREAREYTEKYCPTPVRDYVRTDSVSFDINRDKIAEALQTQINEGTNFRAYKKAGFSFQWTLRSDKDKKMVYFDKKYTPKDYNK